LSKINSHHGLHRGARHAARGVGSPYLLLQILFHVERCNLTANTNGLTIRDGRRARSNPRPRLRFSSRRHVARVWMRSALTQLGNARGYLCSRSDVRQPIGAIPACVISPSLRALSCWTLGHSCSLMFSAAHRSALLFDLALTVGRQHRRFPSVWSVSARTKALLASRTNPRGNLRDTAFAWGTLMHVPSLLAETQANTPRAFIVAYSRL